MDLQLFEPFKQKDRIRTLTETLEVLKSNNRDELRTFSFVSLMKK